MDRSRDNGADACLAWGDAATSRQFTITVGEDGYATLRNVNSGRMLDAADGNLVPGTRVQQYGTQAVANAQKWAFRANDDGTYTVVSKASGLALDVCDAVATGGVRVQLYTPKGTAGQKWVLTSVERALEDGLYTFSTLLDGGKSVTVQDNATADGIRVQLWSRSGVPAQKFLLSWHAYSVPSDPANEDEGVQQEGSSSTEAALDAPEEEIPEQSPVEAWAVSLRPMTATGQYLTAWDNRAVTLEQPSESEWLRQLWIPTYASAGGVQFQNVATKEMLDVSDAGTYDGCPIGTYPSNNTLGQAYYADIVDPIDQGTYIVQSVSDGRALDVVDGSRSNGANVQLWTPNDSGAQAWVIEGVGGGFYNVINARSKKALDVADGVWAAQTNVQQYTRKWSNAQKWYAVANEDGSYSFVSPDGRCALDAADGGGWDGANVQIYYAHYLRSAGFRRLARVLHDVFDQHVERHLQHAESVELVQRRRAPTGRIRFVLRRCRPVRRCRGLSSGRRGRRRRLRRRYLPGFDHHLRCGNPRRVRHCRPPEPFGAVYLRAHRT